MAKPPKGLGEDRRDAMRAVYDKHTDEFEEHFAQHFSEHSQGLLDGFVKLLPGGVSVLDLGSGPGHYAAYMRGQGCEVLCVDLSPEMVTKCEEQGLEAVVGDIENLDLGDRRFAGIWMHASLLHVPRQYIPGVVASLCDYLEPGGVLGLTVWEGEGEGPREQDAEKYGDQRWYTYFTDDDIRQLFGTHFVVGALQRSRIGADKVMLSYYMTSRVHP